MSEVVPLQACPEIEVWWHHDEHEPRPGAKPALLTAALPAAIGAASARKHRLAAPPQHRDAIIDAASAAPPLRRGANRIILALVLGFVAIGLALVGLTVNTRFAASFGQTAEAAMLLAAIGLTIDLLAIALPSAAAQFWRDRNIMAASAAWAIWLIALGMTLWQQSGLPRPTLATASPAAAGSRPRRARSPPT